MNLLGDIAPSAVAAGGPQWLFALLAALAVVTALLVVFHRKLVIQALFLVLHMLTIAGLYLLLGAYFLAAIQVIVYAGAITVLIVFVIMLLNLHKEARGGPGMLPLGLALVLGLLLVLLLGRAARDFAPVTNGLALDPDFGSVAQIAEALFGNYFFPFEIVSLILLAGMIGAIMLAKRNLEG